MKRKQNGIAILYSVNDRGCGIYVETNILEKAITFREGLRRRRLTLGEAERLEFLLKRQIDRINDRWQDNHSKEAGSDKAEFQVCHNCGKEERSIANFCGNCGCELNVAKKEETEEEKFERLLKNYLKSHKRVLFITGGEGEEEGR